MEWPIQELARLSGTTSRALRHYDQIGLLSPSRVGTNGYRYYDEKSAVKLQRILLLKELGLSLASIAEVLTGQREHTAALIAHLGWLRQEKARLDRQIAAVEGTIGKLEGGQMLMAEEMFDGFDHTQYRDEVERRWGAEAYAAGDTWWRGKTAAQKKEWLSRSKTLGAEWVSASERGVDPGDDEAQALARRQFEWLRGIPGTPGGGAAGPTKEYFVGLAELYVADPRFAANYGGAERATFVHDAMKYYADRNL